MPRSASGSPNMQNIIHSILALGYSTRDARTRIADSIAESEAERDLMKVSRGDDK